MIEKTVIPIWGDEVAPRFDLASEIQIFTLSSQGLEEGRTVILPEASQDKLCHLIITENAKTVICGGIEDEYYQYLVWKRVRVIDGVIGSWHQAFERLMAGTLEPGDIFCPRTVEGRAC